MAEVKANGIIWALTIKRFAQHTQDFGLHLQPWEEELSVLFN